jgi:hypothetical protein
MSACPLTFNFLANSATALFLRNTLDEGAEMGAVLAAVVDLSTY